jgi:transcriptional regulator with XRE-family HTH domain
MKGGYIMNTRLKKLRRALDLTQAAFAERIGMKQNTIATYEMARSVPSDQAIRSICREFNVNEEWLRNGTGEMFKASPSSALDALAAEYNMSHAAYIMVEKFVNMKPEHQQVIINCILEAAAAIGDTPIETPAFPSGEESGNIGIDIGTVSAEAAYEKTLNSAQNMDSSASSTTEGTEERIG